MKRLFNFILQPWFLALLGIILLSLIIWYIGPLIAIADYKPLTSETVRLVIIFVIFIAWGLNNLRAQKADKKSEKSLADSLVENNKNTSGKPSDKNVQPPTQDEQILTKRLREALSLLQTKTSRFNRQSQLYSLPWYIIIGAPGSGKTTALKQSGLKFPLRSKLGDEPVQGVGGTRYCDWWFTNEAIFIDTAGRYTTQDNPKKVETRAWVGFLSKLKKVRPKRPLSGIILTISIEDVINKTATQQGIQTTAIKQRIQELNHHLSMELPVYVVFTKTDRISGFNSFFADLEEEEQKQPWGITFTNTETKKVNTLLEQLPSEYNALIERLNNRVLKRLNEEKNPQRRSQIFSFPEQMLALGKPVNAFVSNIFSPNQFEDPFMLRGIYFVSGTQTNMPSQLVSSVLPLEQCTPPVDYTAGEPKTFFVQSLFKDIIFAEANVASLDAKARKRFYWVYRGAIAISLLCFTGLVFAWHHSKILNTAYIAEVDQSINQYQEVTHSGLQNPHDWQTLNSGLDILKSTPTGFDQSNADYPFSQGLGLYQGQKIGTLTQAAYLKALESFFMNDIASMLSQQISLSLTKEDQLYEALKFYLMLFYPDKMDKESFTVWSNILWERLLPGDNNQLLREHLNIHLANALNNDIYPLNIDSEKVENARQILIQTPLDQRLYRRLKHENLNENSESFSLNKILGKKADIIFYRRSGRPLAEGIPELFTYNGFYTKFSIQNKKLAQRLTDEQWIYGDQLHDTITEDEIENISQRVNEYYFNEYNQRWEDFLNDIAIRSFTTLDNGQAVLRMLASSEAPLIDVLQSIRKNTALSEPPKISQSNIELAANVTEAIAPNEQDRLERLVPQDMSNQIKLPGYPVSEHFNELNDYAVADEGLPLSQLQQSLNQLYEYFQSLIYANDMEQAAFQASLDPQSITAIKKAIAEAPPVVQQWFDGITKDTSQVTSVAVRGHLNSAWQAEVVSYYDVALKGRYPIAPQSKQDIKMADFAAFFGPEGVLDNYFNQYIAPFADTSSSPWRWKKTIGLSTDVLRLFERAQRIQNAYFNGGSNPSVSFVMKPNELSNVSTRFLLEVAGTEISYQHGPIRSTEVHWPSDSNQTKMSFTLSSKGTPITVRTEGDWSWFHLLDQYAQVTKQAGKDSWLINFAVDGVGAIYELRPQSVYNPYDQHDLENFELPRRL